MIKEKKELQYKLNEDLENKLGIQLNLSKNLTENLYSRNIPLDYFINNLLVCLRVENPNLVSITDGTTFNEALIKDKENLEANLELYLQIKCIELKCKNYGGVKDFVYYIINKENISVFGFNIMIITYPVIESKIKPYVEYKYIDSIIDKYLKEDTSFLKNELEEEPKLDFLNYKYSYINFI